MERIDISHLDLPSNFHKITDFYLPEENPTLGIYYPGPVTINDSTELNDFVSKLIEITKKDDPQSQFNLELIHNGKRIILRGHSIMSTEGRVYVYRRLPSYIPKLEDLGLPVPITEILLSDTLNTGGLVIIAGETGQGKSTTAGSMISYRLKNFGSFCLTIEDPIELPLQGFHFNEEKPNIKGVCFQSPTTEDTLLDSIKSSLRCFPSVNNSILFLGETRDAQMASEVLKAAANGHLVITTFHGGDIINSLRRFISLASSVKGTNESDVKMLLSSVFKLMVHQRLLPTLDGKKRIKPTVLFSHHYTSQTANKLRTGNLEQLSTEIQTQNSAVLQNKSILNMHNQ